MPDPVPPDLIDEFLTPVSVDRPAGDYLDEGDDPEYSAFEDAVKAADTALKAAHQTNAPRPDWGLVVNLGRAILCHRSKDLYVATRVTEAMARKSGLPGLRDGVRILTAIQEKFWDTAHPSGPLRKYFKLYLARLDEDWGLPFVVRSVPVAGGPGVPVVTYRQYTDRSKTGTPNPGAPQGEGTSIDDALKATAPAYFEATCASLEGCIEAVTALNQSILNRMDAKCPNLGKTLASLDAVKQLVTTLLRAKEPVDPPTPPDAPGKPEAEPASSTERTPTPPPVAPTAPSTVPGPAPAAPSSDASSSDLDRVKARVVEAAEALRKVDLADPTPYLLLRALRAGELYGAAEAFDADPPAAPAPDRTVGKRLARLLADRDWQGLIHESEGVLARPESRAWLDLHYFTASALAGLKHDQAAKALLALVGGLLKDHGAWPNARFEDLTPCAVEETRKWVAKTFPAADGTADRADASRAHGDDPGNFAGAADLGGRAAPGDAAPGLWDQAQQYCREGRAQEATRLLARGMAEATSPRERFRLTLLQAKLCWQLKRPAVAAPLLVSLARQVDDAHLERWESPEFYAEVFELLYLSSRGQDDARAAAAYARLCQADPGRALELTETDPIH